MAAGNMPDVLLTQFQHPMVKFSSKKVIFSYVLRLKKTNKLLKSNQIGTPNPAFLDARVLQIAIGMLVKIQRRTQARVYMVRGLEENKYLKVVDLVDKNSRVA